MKKITMLMSGIFALLMLFSCGNATINDVSKNSTLDTTITEEIADTPAQEITNEQRARLDKLLAIGGPGDYCEHDVVLMNEFVLDNSYHSLLSMFTLLVDSKKYEDWKAEQRAIYEENTPDECQTYFTIVKFIDEFNISRESFEAMAEKAYYVCDYDFNVLFSGNAEKIEAYYLNGASRIPQIIKKQYIYTLKASIVSYLNNTDAVKYEAWIHDKENSGSWKYADYSLEKRLLASVVTSDGSVKEFYSGVFTGDYRQWSIAEIVEYFDISKEIMEELSTNVNWKDSCSLNYERLYSDNAFNALSTEIRSKDNTKYPAVNPVLLDDAIVEFDLEYQIELWEKQMNGQ